MGSAATMTAMTRTFLTSLVAFALLLSGAARAQETFDSLGGTWWFKIGGKDAGAVVIQFSEPIAGSFGVEPIAVTGLPSFGFSRNLGAFFTIAEGQMLTIDSKGNPVGDLEIEDADSAETLGTFTFEKGKPNKKFTKWNLRASFVGADPEPVVVKLTGQRIPDNFPVLTGLNPMLTLGGQRVSSKAFSTAVLTSEDLGLPAYSFVGSGPAEIDKVENPDVDLSGRFMLTPKFEIVGLLEDSSDFGTGFVSGKLKLSGDTLVPKLSLTATAERKVTLKGSLVEPVEPVLSVTPSSFEFPAQRLNDPNNPDGQPQTFSVSNVGADEPLEGSARFLSGSDPDFQFEDPNDVSYGPLFPDDAAVPIVVVFNPITAGTKTARLLFGVDGGAGARIVTLTGQGGIPEIRLDVDSIAFDDTTVNQSRFEIVTVHNDGDGLLRGSVTVSGTDFSIFRPGAVNPDGDGEIEYEVGPGQSVQFSVRFRPTDDVDRSGTLSFTGGGGDTITLTGTGIP
jgi:hypothetical protein